MLPDVNYLQPTEFLIRAMPEKIEISESYERKIQQNIAVRRDNGEEPKGTIEIVVPYDGEQFFDKTAAFDATNHEMKEPIWRETEHLLVRGRIGYLRLQNAEKTDLVEQLNKQESGLSQENMLPIEVTLRDVAGRRYHAPLNDQHICKQKIEYKLDLKGAPVTLEFVEKEDGKPDRLVHISDEEQIVTAANRWHVDNAILSRLRRQAPLSDQYTIPITIALTFNFLPKSDLPNTLKVALQIDCPTSESAGLIKLVALENDENKVLTSLHRVEDEDGAADFLSWSDIPLTLEPFEPSEDEPEQKKAVYKSAAMSLVLKEPVTFRDVEKISGRVKCAPEWLFSGVEFLYFDAYGQIKPDVQSLLKVKSDVSIQFEIDLIRFSQDKLSVPYQRFHFVDVRFEEDRVDDVIKVLRELSFDVDKAQDSRETIVPENEANKPMFTILAKREGGKGEANGRLIRVVKQFGERKIELYIHIYGFQLVTTRERHAHAGQDKYTSDWQTGYTVVDMGGTSYGDSKRLVAVMNTIHNELKALFEHVSSGT